MSFLPLLFFHFFFKSETAKPHLLLYIATSWGGAVWCSKPSCSLFFPNTFYSPLFLLRFCNRDFLRTNKNVIVTFLVTIYSINIGKVFRTRFSVSIKNSYACVYSMVLDNNLIVFTQYELHRKKTHFYVV